MLFQIKDRFDKGVFVTEYPECIPFESLDSIESAGLTFYIDGKKVSKSFIKNHCKDFVETSNDEGSDVVATDVTSDDVEEKNSEPEFNLTDPGFTITNRTIICVNTGKMYKNQKAAADEYETDPANISYCVTTGKAYKGLYFKRAVDK